MSQRNHEDKVKRRLTVKERRDRNREDRRKERALLKRMLADKGHTGGETIRGLEESAPIPPRNGPCPLHPQYKFKKCPHGCLSLFHNHRSRVAGDTILIPVDPDATRSLGKDPQSGLEFRQKLVGTIGVEDAAAATIREIHEVTKDE